MLGCICVGAHGSYMSVHIYTASPEHVPGSLRRTSDASQCAQMLGLACVLIL